MPDIYSRIEDTPAATDQLGFVRSSGNRIFPLRASITALGTALAGIAQTVSGVQTFSSMFRVPTATVAATGSTQANAAAITTGFTLVSAADATKGVRLPTAVAGDVAIVKNGAAAILKIWPATSDGINAIAVDGSLDIAANTSVLLVAYDATTWYSVPLLPS